ncbi:MAG TPA: 7TM-DISM domain-containing protein, partial [Arenibaculum sp.]|nr:7TM-DISM domain-containing protein [Arenibaculum sp.]
MAHAGNVVLTDEIDSYMLGPALELFEDPTGMLSVADVADPGFAGPFRRSGLQIPSPGLSRSAWWARIDFDTTVAPERVWYLVHRQAITDRISVFVPRPDGGWTSLHGGLLSNEHFFHLDHRYWVFPVTLPAGSDVSVYVRVENRDNIILPLALQTVDALYRADRVEQLLFGA